MTRRKWGGRLVLLASLLLPLAALAGKGVEVQTLDGKRSGLGEVLSQDKWTLVMVWTTYCGFCRQQYPLISEFHTKHADKDAVVLGISLDGYDQAAKVAAYQKERAHSFPSVLADAGDFAAKYEKTIGDTFTGTPTYLMFDPKGTLRGYLDGPITLEAIEKSLAD